MKKAILPLLAAIALALSFSSCEHQTMRTAEVTIQPYEWVTNNNVNYYFVTKGWDELDQDVIDYGLVNVYLINNETGLQDMLPLVTPITYYYDDDNGGVIEYTIAENIRFDIRYGEITFIVQDQDGELPEDMSSTLPMTFRIVALGD